MAIVEETQLSYEDCRAEAVGYLDAMKSAVRERTLSTDSEGLIATLTSYVIPFLTNNELASLESCLSNAVSSLRNGTKAPNPTRGFYSKPKEVVQRPANPELAAKYDHIAGYVSHAMFERKNPF